MTSFTTLRGDVKTWSLASDEKLFKGLGQLADSMFERTTKTLDSFSELRYLLNSCNNEVSNTFSQFQRLSERKFTEQKMAPIQENAAPTEDTKDTVDRTNTEAKQIEFFKKALQLGMEVFNIGNTDDTNNNAADDIDDRSVSYSTSSIQTGASKSIRIPFLIGTNNFNQDKFIGLFDQDENDEEQLDSNSNQAPGTPTANILTSEIYDPNTMNQSQQQGVTFNANIPPAPTFNPNAPPAPPLVNANAPPAPPFNGIPSAPSFNGIPSAPPLNLNGPPMNGIPPAPNMVANTGQGIPPPPPLNMGAIPPAPVFSIPAAPTMDMSAAQNTNNSASLSLEEQLQRALQNKANNPQQAEPQQAPPVSRPMSFLDEIKMRGSKKRNLEEALMQENEPVENIPTPPPPMVNPQNVPSSNIPQAPPMMERKNTLNGGQDNSNNTSNNKSILDPTIPVMLKQSTNMFIDSDEESNKVFSKRAKSRRFDFNTLLNVDRPKMDAEDDGLFKKEPVAQPQGDSQKQVGASILFQSAATTTFSETKKVTFLAPQDQQPVIAAPPVPPPIPKKKLDKLFESSDEDKDPFEKARQIGSQYRKEETKAIEKAQNRMTLSVSQNQKKKLFDDSDSDDVEAFQKKATTTPVPPTQPAVNTNPPLRQSARQALKIFSDDSEEEEKPKVAAPVQQKQPSQTEDKSVAQQATSTPFGGRMSTAARKKNRLEDSSDEDDNTTAKNNQSAQQEAERQKKEQEQKKAEELLKKQEEEKAAQNQIIKQVLEEEAAAKKIAEDLKNAEIRKEQLKQAEELRKAEELKFQQAKQAEELKKAEEHRKEQEQKREEEAMKAFTNPNAPPVGRQISSKHTRSRMVDNSSDSESSDDDAAPPSQTPAQVPVQAPIQAPVQTPVQPPVQAPVQTPVLAAVQTPIQAPAQPPVVKVSSSNPMEDALKASDSHQFPPSAQPSLNQRISSALQEKIKAMGDFNPSLQLGGVMPKPRKHSTHEDEQSEQAENEKKGDQFVSNSMERVSLQKKKPRTLQQFGRPSTQQNNNSSLIVPKELEEDDKPLQVERRTIQIKEVIAPTPVVTKPISNPPIISNPPVVANKPSITPPPQKPKGTLDLGDSDEDEKPLITRTSKAQDKKLPSISSQPTVTTQPQTPALNPLLPPQQVPPKPQQQPQSQPTNASPFSLLPQTQQPNSSHDLPKNLPNISGKPTVKFAENNDIKPTSRDSNPLSMPPLGQKPNPLAANRPSGLPNISEKPTHSSNATQRKKIAMFGDSDDDEDKSTPVVPSRPSKALPQIGQPPVQEPRPSVQSKPKRGLFDDDDSDNDKIKPPSAPVQAQQTQLPPTLSQESSLGRISSKPSAPSGGTKRGKNLFDDSDNDDETTSAPAPPLSRPNPLGGGDFNAARPSMKPSAPTGGKPTNQKKNLFDDSDDEKGSESASNPLKMPAKPATSNPLSGPLRPSVAAPPQQSRPSVASKPKKTLFDDDSD